MAIEFCSIEIFRDALALLCKKRKEGYGSCKIDICDALKDCTFDDIWEMAIRIREYADIRMIKIRVPNSLQNLSSASGFRLIICCNKIDKSVIFLNLYPKTGRHAKEDQINEDYRLQLKLYSDCKKNGTLVKHDISKELSIKKK